MKKASLQTIAKKMKDLDFCMMTTVDGKGVTHSRPMSNNGKVEYDGDSWFFTYEDSNKVQQIKNDHRVSLIYQTDDMLFIDCYGTATIVKDKEVLQEKWIDELEQWFPEGIDTPGICLVKVTSKRVSFWHKEEEGEYISS
ncbi:pyridoxamine 5'-phosphate oxidase family protein [Chryseobacterium wangxinyae]|uniref:pyridoxamine 5'-phosphate oxidase family protein n=1 Tax=Chryseobacterium sp. CY353 TaxID=2997334 RepID=UPI0022721538|nr:pyridoxamine 5'-phosphate oxidase family protein [Chryseobacterium sp. CY353]MCY0969321.1 pyridoxamine 5'-phosphate oxidase family protein [Chryseobacterium sp. CY353]